MSGILHVFAPRFCRVSNFDMLFPMIGFISLIDEITFMLINSRHFCPRSITMHLYSCVTLIVLYCTSIVHARRGYRKGCTFVSQLIKTTFDCSPQVYFRVDNGGGVIVAKHGFSSVELCDGRWHKIKARKFDNNVWLQVDGAEYSKAVGKPSSTVTNVNNALYVGGLPGKQILCERLYHTLIAAAPPPLPPPPPTTTTTTTTIRY